MLFSIFTPTHWYPQILWIFLFTLCALPSFAQSQQQQLDTTSLPFNITGYSPVVFTKLHPVLSHLGTKTPYHTRHLANDHINALVTPATLFSAVSSSHSDDTSFSTSLQQQLAPCIEPTCPLQLVKVADYITTQKSASTPDDIHFDEHNSIETAKSDVTPPSHQCQLVHIGSTIRHGTRGLAKTGQSIELAKILKKAQKVGGLVPQTSLPHDSAGNDVLAWLDPNSPAFDGLFGGSASQSITAIGRLEMYGFGVRLGQRIDLMRAFIQHILTISTWKHRTLQSILAILCGMGVFSSTEQQHQHKSKIQTPYSLQIRDINTVPTLVCELSPTTATMTTVSQTESCLIDIKLSPDLIAIHNDPFAPLSSTLRLIHTFELLFIQQAAQIYQFDSLLAGDNQGHNNTGGFVSTFVRLGSHRLTTSIVIPLDRQGISPMMHMYSFIHPFHPREKEHIKAHTKVYRQFYHNCTIKECLDREPYSLDNSQVLSFQNHLYSPQEFSTRFDLCQIDAETAPSSSGISHTTYNADHINRVFFHLSPETINSFPDAFFQNEFTFQNKFDAAALRHFDICQRYHTETTKSPKSWARFTNDWLVQTCGVGSMCDIALHHLFTHNYIEHHLCGPKRLKSAISLLLQIATGGKHQVLRVVPNARNIALNSFLHEIEIILEQQQQSSENLVMFIQSYLTPVAPLNHVSPADAPNTKQSNSNNDVESSIQSQRSKFIHHPKSNLGKKSAKSDNVDGINISNVPLSIENIVFAFGQAISHIGISTVHSSPPTPNPLLNTTTDNNANNAILDNNSIATALDMLKKELFLSLLREDASVRVKYLRQFYSLCNLQLAVHDRDDAIFSQHTGSGLSSSSSVLDDLVQQKFRAEQPLFKQALWPTQFCQVLTNPLIVTLHQQTTRLYQQQQQQQQQNSNVFPIQSMLSSNSLPYGIYGDSIIDLHYDLSLTYQLWTTTFASNALNLSRFDDPMQWDRGFPVEGSPLIFLFEYLQDLLQFAKKGNFANITHSLTYPQFEQLLPVFDHLSLPELGEHLKIADSFSKASQMEQRNPMSGDLTLTEDNHYPVNITLLSGHAESILPFLTFLIGEPANIDEKQQDKGKKYLPPLQPPLLHHNQSILSDQTFDQPMQQVHETTISAQVYGHKQKCPHHPSPFVTGMYNLSTAEQVAQRNANSSYNTGWHTSFHSTLGSNLAFFTYACAPSPPPPSNSSEIDDQILIPPFDIQTSSLECIATTPPPPHLNQTLSHCPQFQACPAPQAILLTSEPTPTTHTSTTPSENNTVQYFTQFVLNEESLPWNPELTSRLGGEITGFIPFSHPRHSQSMSTPGLLLEHLVPTDKLRQALQTKYAHYGLSESGVAAWSRHCHVQWFIDPPIGEEDGSGDE